MNKAPPFRADQVGSLLRPAVVKQAREDFANGNITAGELRAVEDAAIEALVAKQESIGIGAVTDGEIRRESWLGDFLSGLDGTETVLAVPGVVPQGTDAPTKRIRIQTITGKLGFSEHVMLEHFGFLKKLAHVTAKMTIPAPAMLISASRDWREIIAQDVYPEIEGFYEDVGATYRAAVHAFYEAGCRYLQFDDVNLAYLCDPSWREKLQARGDDPDRMLESWVAVVNEAIADRPEDMFITTHVCRGNFRSSWFAEGGYEPIADMLLNRFDYDGYFLEYDTDRAGGFEPLRFLPKGDKAVVLGLITTKSGALENRDAIKKRIEAASKFVDIDQLCLSPQCGFASTEEGNLLAEEEQWNKLTEVVEIANEVWPDG